MQLINKVYKFFFQVYIALLSVIPTEIGIQLRYFAYKPLFKLTEGKFRIDSGVTISGFENIEFGKDIRIEKNAYIYAINAEIKLGNKFFLGNNSQLCASRADIEIGDFCMIAPNCILVSDNHRFDRVDIPIMEQGYSSEKIVLEQDIWIASNTIVLKGVRIEQGSVVAAGSVVNKNVKAYSVVGGVPVKLIKKRGALNND